MFLQGGIPLVSLPYVSPSPMCRLFFRYANFSTSSSSIVLPGLRPSESARARADNCAGPPGKTRARTVTLRGPREYFQFYKCLHSLCVVYFSFAQGGTHRGCPPVLQNPAGFWSISPYREAERDTKKNQFLLPQTDASNSKVQRKSFPFCSGQIQTQIQTYFSDTFWSTDGRMD